MYEAIFIFAALLIEVLMAVVVIDTIGYCRRVRKLHKLTKAENEAANKEQQELRQVF